MDRPHLVIVILVALLVFGGGGFAVYKLYVHPRATLAAEQRKLERTAAEEEARPDPAEVAFADTAGRAAAAASPENARALWSGFLERFPDSPRAAEARRALTPLNVADLFSPRPDDSKTIHTVARGDSLYKIARQNGTTIDLVARANGLEGTMLQIGQQLVVPKLQITATADRQAGTLRLDNHGEFLAEYPLLSARITAVPEGTGTETRVTDLVVETDGKRVTYGQTGYAEGRRSIVLSPPGGSIVAAAPETPGEELPGGWVVQDGDMSDIFVLLSRGVPVTIR